MVRVSKTMANSYSWQKNRKTRTVTARETADFNRGKVNNVIGRFDGFDEEALKKDPEDRTNGINKNSNKGLSKNALWSAEMVKHAQQYVEKGIPIDEFTNASPSQYGGETMMQVRKNVEEFIIESIVEQELEGIEEELTEAEALTIEEIEELDEIVMEFSEVEEKEVSETVFNIVDHCEECPHASDQQCNDCMTYYDEEGDQGESAEVQKSREKQGNV